MDRWIDGQMDRWIGVDWIGLDQIRLDLDLDLDQIGIRLDQIRLDYIDWIRLGQIRQIDIICVRV